MLLSEVPEIHGRSEAGVSVTSSGHAKPTTSIAAPPASSWRIALSFSRMAGRVRTRTQIQATAIPGTTISATPILVSKPSPTATPLRINQRVLPSSSARNPHHNAATEQSTNSSSGLL